MVGNRVRDGREDALRTMAARFVQAARHHLTYVDPGPGSPSSRETVAELAALLDAGAPVGRVVAAVSAVVDAYEWPSGWAPDDAEDLGVPAAVVAAIERLRAAMDDFDEAS